VNAPTSLSPAGTPFAGRRLCVVGNLNRDIKTAPLRPGEYLFHDGETSLDGVSETIGGGGANSAAIAATLGAQATFIGQIGADTLGDRLEAALRRHGVACALHRTPEQRTGTTVNLVFDTGERHFLSCLPNNETLSFSALDLTALAGADHLLRADIWFSEAMLQDGNERLLRAARELGVTTSIDLNWDPHWGRASSEHVARRKAAVRRVLPLVDLAHGNVRELNEFTGETELSASVQRLLEWGVRGVVAHLGARGAGWFSAGECHIEPAAPISRRVMATGTGDVLSVCAMLLSHCPEIPWVEKLRLANQVVAEFIEGRRTLIPTMEAP